MPPCPCGHAAGYMSALFTRNHRYSKMIEMRSTSSMKGITIFTRNSIWGGGVHFRAGTSAEKNTAPSLNIINDHSFKFKTMHLTRPWS